MENQSNTIHFRITWQRLLVLALAFLLSSCSLINPAAGTPAPSATTTAGQEDNTVISEGHLAPRDFKYLAFPINGRVSEILVKKGDAVSEGQVLARLGDREQAEASQTAANLELESAQQALDQLNRTAELTKASAWQALLDARKQKTVAQEAWDKVDTDAYQEKIDDAEVDVNKAKKELDDAQADFDRYKDLDPDNATRKRYEDDLKRAQDKYDEAVNKRDLLVIERDKAKAALEQATALVNEMQYKYDNAQSGPDKDQLALAQKRLANAQAQVTAARAAMDNFDLTAPFSGTVVDINITVNELVKPGGWAILVADFGSSEAPTWYVDTSDLTELEVVKISVGQQVRILPDALPGVELSGVVTEISSVATTQAGDITYKVRVRLDQSDPRLRWGMTMELHFAEPSGESK